MFPSTTLSMGTIIGRITESAEETRERLAPTSPPPIVKEQLGELLKVAGLHVDSDLEFGDSYGDVELTHLVDMLVEEKVIVEVRYRHDQASIHDRLALMRHYMRLAKKSHGVLVSFGREEVCCKALVQSVLVHI